jgi:DNA-binding CsgD family transcriptional regulator
VRAPVTDADVGDLASLRAAVERALPAKLSSTLRTDRHAISDLVSEVIAEACATFEAGRRSFRAWCGYLAAHRGWELHQRLLGLTDLRDAPMLLLDAGLRAERDFEPASPPLCDVALSERHTQLLDRVGPLLTKRQLAIVTLLAEGRSLSGVAHDLGLSREALNYQKKRIAVILTGVSGAPGVKSVAA